MKYVIFGCGFIGRYILKHLNGEFVIITRNPSKFKMKNVYKWDAPLDVFENSDVFINLAGESIFGFWSKKKKENILKSRIETTKRVVDIIKNLKSKPGYFFNASATGYYGDRGNEIITEDSPSGNDFLSTTAKLWEEEATKAEAYTKCVIMRFGVVLGDNTFIKTTRMLFNLHLGFYIVNKEIWQSYIHIIDVAEIIKFIIEKKLTGVFNFTAEPVTQKEFVDIFSGILKKRQFLKIPEFMFDLNEFTKMLKNSVRAVPEKLLKAGYKFRFYSMREAISYTLNQSS